MAVSLYQSMPLGMINVGGIEEVDDAASAALLIDFALQVRVVLGLCQWQMPRGGPSSSTTNRGTMKRQKLETGGGGMAFEAAVLLARSHTRGGGDASQLRTMQCQSERTSRTRDLHAEGGVLNPGLGEACEAGKHCFSVCQRGISGPAREVKGRRKKGGGGSIIMGKDFF